jgi:single-stranded DNA-specific DHH superfamily exonuclease
MRAGASAKLIWACVCCLVRTLKKPPVWPQRLNDFNAERRNRLRRRFCQRRSSGGRENCSTQCAAAITLLARKGWHPGVIGIVAGRLKDKYHRPSFIIALDDDGMGKGSARSVSAVDIGRLVAGRWIANSLKQVAVMPWRRG